jgi:hypothetical protein
VLNSLWFGKLDDARAQLRVIENREIHGDSLRAARRCATAATAEAARACARRTVPSGLILGDPERLRSVSEHMLAQPLPRAARGVAGIKSASRAPDAGADAGGPIVPGSRP